MMALSSFLLVGAFLFACGLACVLTRRNLIRILMGIELIFNGAALNFVAFSHFQPAVANNIAMSGDVFALFIIGLAATEAVVALALVLAVYRVIGHVCVDRIDGLKG